MAERAKVSGALVHYHFATRQRLLEAAADRLLERRMEERVRHVRLRKGLDALDAIWTALSSGASARVEGAAHDLTLLARHAEPVRLSFAEWRRSEQEAFAAALPRVLAELGSSLPVSPEEAAVLVLRFLDGVALAVDQGVPTEDVRAAFDAFWLVLVAAGQARAH